MNTSQNLSHSGAKGLSGHSLISQSVAAGHPPVVVCILGAKRFPSAKGNPLGKGTDKKPSTARTKARVGA